MNLGALKTRLEALTGFKKYAAAFVLGAVMVLSMPPVGAFYALLLSVPGFIWLTQVCRTKREAFATGWAFGAGYFIFGLYWISYALFIDIHEWWWVLPFSLILGPALMGLYYGFIPLLAWRYRKNKAAFALMLVAAFALVEWVRGHALTGFPWNLAGYTWHYLLPLMQVNALIGIYGLTLLTLLWAAMPALKGGYGACLMALFVVAGTWGMMRVSLNPPEANGDYTVRIVQPNIQQSFKWSEEEKWNNFRHQLDLTAQTNSLKKPLTFIIWPETAVITERAQFTEIASHIAMNMPSGSVTLLGNLAIDGERYYNSVIALNKRGELLDAYSKHHLVPFGEYIPFRNYLKLTPVASGIANVGDFTRGAGLANLSVGERLPRPSPLICYEVIFPGAVAKRDDRPDWLVNVTNDAWYGRSAGPYQHFEIARVRAIEEGLPLARAANTGISAMIDPLGRIAGIKALGRTGVVDAELPKAFPPTLYTKTGDALFFLMLLVLGILGERLRLKK